MVMIIVWFWWLLAVVHLASVSSYPTESPKSLVPFKVLFVTHSSINPKNKAILDRAFSSLNNRINLMLNSPPISDVRFRRAPYDKVSKSCGPPQANNKLLIPPEFSMPCFDHKGQLVQETDVPPEPTEYIRSLGDQNFTHVIYVGVYMDTVSGQGRKCHHNAWAGTWMSDPQSGRPTHGGILICWKELWKQEEKEVENLLAHELLHVVGVDFKQGKEGITWKTVNRQWLEKNGTTTNASLTLSLLPSVVEAARNYFNCPTLEGVIVHGNHLPQHLYEQDVLARASSHSVISPLALGALKDTGWYDVDMTKAEPMNIGQAVNPRCEINEKSCHQIIKEAVESNHENRALLSPYCVPGKSNLCSIDGKALLECFEKKECPILVTHKYGYQSPICEENTEVPTAQGTPPGSRVGPGTMCLTFLEFPTWKDNDTRSAPMCFKYQCDRDGSRIAFSLFPDGEPCKVHCEEGDSNKIKRQLFSDTCKDKLGEVVSFWCPDYPNICNA